MKDYDESCLMPENVEIVSCIMLVFLVILMLQKCVKGMFKCMLVKLCYKLRLW